MFSTETISGYLCNRNLDHLNRTRIVVMIETPNAAESCFMSFLSPSEDRLRSFFAKHFSSFQVGRVTKLPFHILQ